MELKNVSRGERVRLMYSSTVEKGKIVGVKQNKIDIKVCGEIVDVPVSDKQISKTIHTFQNEKYKLDSIEIL